MAVAGEDRDTAGVNSSSRGASATLAAEHPRPAARGGAAALYDDHGTLAFSLAYRIVRDHGVAEEVVQEAFLSLWRNEDRFDAARGSLRALVCHAVRNRALDRLRGRSGRQRDHQSLDDLLHLPSGDDIAAEVERREQSREVTTALTTLPAEQRQVIELAYFGGYSQTEIAELTDRPLGTVKGRTRLALRALAAALAPLRGAVEADVPGAAFASGA